MTPPHGRTVKGDDDRDPVILPPDTTMLEQTPAGEQADTRAPTDERTWQAGAYGFTVGRRGNDATVVVRRATGELLDRREAHDLVAAIWLGVNSYGRAGDVTIETGPRPWLVYRRSDGMGGIPTLVTAATPEEAAKRFNMHAIVVPCEVF